MTERYRLCIALLLAAVTGLPACAQTWDAGGNSLLKGTYYFRYVAWQGQYDATNNLQYAIAIYGNIAFSNGTYSLSGAREFDSGNELQQPWFVGGTYSVGANGYGIFSSLFTTGDYLNILVSPSSGVVVGSTRQGSSGYNDLFLAAPLPAASSSSFSGTYSMMGLDDPTLSVADTRSYQLSVTFGAAVARASGYFASGASTLTNQSFSNLKYSYSNGAAAVNFGSELTTANVDTDLMSGTKYFYVAPDGDFIFGGSPNGWDFIVGVRQSSDAVSGLYYRAGMAQDDSPAAANHYVNLDSWYGALDAIANGVLLGHRHVLQVSRSSNARYDLTYTDSLNGSAGSYSDSFNQYLFSAGGAYGIGFEGLENGSSLGIEVLVESPQPASPGGVYIDPAGVVSAASSAPFTAGWAPGELISIYGTNLASTSAVDGTLPMMLGQVEVLVNGVPSPIYSVSPGQINAIVPIGISTTTTPVATIQVTNGAGSSNTVFNYLGETQPGVFNSVGGVPAIQHADYSMVSSSSPAEVGETLVVYLTGLGAVDAKGNVTNAITSTIDGVPADIAYAGTGSLVGGAYQMNVTVPNGVSAGNVHFNITGPDSINSSTMIPVGNGGTAKVSADRVVPLLPRSPRVH